MTVTQTAKESSSDMAAQPNKQPPATPTPVLEHDYKYQVFPSTITGVLHFQNSGAFDWSRNGFLAYGCQNRIVVVDTNNTMKYCQTLHRHKHNVCHVKWSPECSGILASIDVSGMIVVWNVIESSTLAVILSTNETKSVSWFSWITIEKPTPTPADDTPIQSPNLVDPATENHQKMLNIKAGRSTEFLLVFCSQINSLILYDSERGDCLARWTLDYRVNHVELNPFFTFNRSCDSSVFNLLLTFKSQPSTEERVHIGIARISENDFLRNTDEGNSRDGYRKLVLAFECFHIHNSGSGEHLLGNSRASPSSRSSRFDVISRVERDKYKQHLVPYDGPSTSSSHSRDSTGSTNQHQQDYGQLVQIEFNKSMRNQIFIVFPRDIYLLDLSIETVIAVIPIERNCSKIQRIFSCSHRNAFYVFHESGNVSFRLYQKKIIMDRSAMLSPSSAASQSMSGDDLGGGGGSGSGGGGDTSHMKSASFLNISYINLCQSEQIRLTKQNKILGSALSLFDETRVAFLLSSGRVLVKSLIYQRTDKKEDSVGVIVNHTLALPSLCDLIKPQEYQLGAFLLAPGDSNSSPQSSILYKILVTQCINGLSAMPAAIRMCPPLTNQNIHVHRPYLAVGDALGVIQIWLLRDNTSSLHREFSVHSYSVAGIEWTSLTSLISFAYPTISSPSHRESLSSGFSLGSMVTGSGSSSGRVTNELFHIDINTGKATAFRTNRVNDSSPIETVRVSHLKQYMIILFKNGDPFEIWDVKTLTLLRVMSKNMADVSAVEWSPLNRTRTRTSTKSKDGSASEDCDPPVQRESFIVTNRDLFHCSIEGTHLKELSCFPPDSDNSHVNVTSIAWKSDHVIIGDASGALNLWHLTKKYSKTESSFRGCIKKLRFAPGKGNYYCLILYADFGVDIWDISELKVVAQLKYPRDSSFKIIDIDWAGSDYPILATADGFIFITNSKLRAYSSPFHFPHYGVEKVANFVKKFVAKDGFVPDSMFNLKLNINVHFLGAFARKNLVRDFQFAYTEVVEDEESDEKSRHQEFDLRQYLHSQIVMARVFSNQCDADFWNIFASILFGEELDSRLDLFLDSKQYRHLQQELLMLLEANRRTYQHAHFAYQMNLRLRNFQRAVTILLETDAFQQANNSGAFYLNALKACLITALQGDSSPGTSLATQRPLSATGSILSRSGIFNEGDVLSDFEVSVEEPADVDSKECTTRNDAVAPVVKLVATSLIANGNILQGVELLNFISKTADSCRYLQSADKWLDSVWLAKASLDQNDCTEVMRRWCDMLLGSKLSSDQQIVFKMYLSRRQFSRVLRGLNRVRDLKAFAFGVCCVAAQLIDIDANRDILEEIFDRFAREFYGLEVEDLVKVKKLDADEQEPEKKASEVTEEGKAGSQQEEKPQGYEVLRQFWRLFTK